MNRQFRRAQEKQDKRQEKERERRRSERRSKRRRSRPARVKPKPSGNGSAEKGKEITAGAGEESKETATKGAAGGKGEQKQASRKRLPGRFSGVLTFVTVFFISLQGAAPIEEEQATVGASLISAGFYLMLGYFATLWFMRRGVNRAPMMSVIGGVILAGSVTAATLIQGRELDLLLLALVIPALIAGSLLGRLVFVASPR